MSSSEAISYLSGLCAGDNKAIKSIYAECSQSVKTWVLRNNASVADAKDVFQSAIVAIYEKYCGKNLSDNEFQRLLFSIARNMWRKKLTKDNREEEIRNSADGEYSSEVDDPDVLVKAEEAMAEHQRQVCLEKTFQMLSERCQKVLQLMANGISGEQIAEQLGMSNRNTVFVRAFECKKRWRTLFDEHCKS